MSQTSVLGITFPTENEDPYFETYETQMERIDLLVRTSWEDGALVVVGGGELSLVSDTVAWSSAIKLVNGRTNATITIPAGNVIVPDGQVASITAVSRPMANQTLSTWSVSSGGPTWDPSKIPIFKRIGGNVYVFYNQIGLERLTLEAP